ncbi:MAG: deoxyguanosinetriphosphate triphosphohydrolase [Burkholderiales bacterium]|nr:deoxyguanosinetriphosphate triphosphohydrolase [Burkholderiales bacterium]
MIPENLILAPYACKSNESRGRVHQEPPSKARTEFQRDHDRIIHSAAFRRLEYKTQVFVNHEGDLFRTRLTHSLEVAQISRSIASRLSLNTDLAEAIALAHDLGHTPFGHAGQDALNECMKDFGGFEHNLQSLRIIDRLEEQYPRFNGLNLTWEAREGVLKHCKLETAKTLGDIGKRFLLGQQPSLEAQLVNIADAIAYSTHDIDDGLRQQILHNDGLMDEVPIWKHYFEQAYKEYSRIPLRRLQKETVRRVIGKMVDDLYEESTKNINLANPQSPNEVRALSKPLISFSPEIQEQMRILKDYLMKNLYKDYQVQREVLKNTNTVKKLFEVFTKNPILLPPRYQDQIEIEGKERTVADYIAGMTDRFALREYERIFDPVHGTA